MNSVVVATQIWDCPEIGLSVKQAEKVPKLRAWLRASNIDIARFLADVSAESIQALSPENCKAIWFKTSEMEKLENAICDECTSLSAAQMDSQIIGKLVGYLNRNSALYTTQNFFIAQPRLHTTLALPKNPFAGEMATSLRSVRAWLKVEKKWIAERALAPPVELVVLSGILHGGLLHTSSVVSFARALFASESKIGFAAGQLYVDLTLPWRGHPDMERRMWRPDDQTASLIWPPEHYTDVRELLDIPQGELIDVDVAKYVKELSDRVSKLSDLQLTNRLFRRIVRKMKHDGVAKDLMPPELADLIDSVAICARASGVPGILVDYATRRIVSHSLKPEVSRRIFKQAAIEPNDELMISEDVIELTDESIESLLGNFDEVPPVGLAGLRAALGPKDQEEVCQNLIELKDSISDKFSIWWVIADFGLYLMKRRKAAYPGNRMRGNFKLNSAKFYAITVGRRLGGEDKLLRLPARAVETLYTGILENAVEGINPQRLQRQVAKVLSEFHDFCVTEHDAKPINVRDILGVENSLLPVDANIIMPEEYNKARWIIRYDMDKIGEAEIGEAERLIAEVALIIGYRGGTRRMEAVGLNIADLIDRGPTWLILREWEERGLKTPNSTRQLPLSVLIPKDELPKDELPKKGLPNFELPRDEHAKLLEWKKYRIGHKLIGDKDDGSLFAIDGKMISETALIEIIHRALRKATGDERVHFHHCRHSFATLNFLRLMLSDLHEIPDLFPDRKETTRWLRESKEFRRDLYGFEDHTRRHTLAIASLLGHSGAKVSTEYYIHCMGWLLPLFFNQCDLLKVKRAGVEAASGGRHSMAVVFKKRFPGLVDSFKTVKPGSSDPIHRDPAAWSTNAKELLYKYGKKIDSLNNIADRLGIEFATAEQMVARAQEIAAIKQGRGRPSTRRVMEYWVPDDSFPNIEVSLGPKRPSDDELKAARELGIALANLAETDEELTQKALSYFLHHAWKTENALPFHDPKKPEDAVHYKSFLEALGLNEEQICFVSFDSPDYSPSRKIWKKAFGFKSRNTKWFEFRKPPFKKTLASAKWIGIEPKFGVDSSGKKLPGSDGFRFLMVMAAIVFGYQREER